MANGNGGVKVGGTVLLPREEIERALRERAFALAVQHGELQPGLSPVDFQTMSNVELPEELTEVLVAWTR